MASFFWSRRSSSKDVVFQVELLLGQLFPEEVFAEALEQDQQPKTSSDEATAEDAKTETETETDGATTPDDDGSEQSDDNDTDENENEHENDSDLDANAKSIPDELERAWSKIRSYFSTWDDESDATRDKKRRRMAELLLRHRVVEKMLIPRVLRAMTFETRKYVGHVFRALTVHDLGGVVGLLHERRHVLRWLVEGYRSNATALVCGAMLRDCFAHEELALMFLQEMPGELAVLFDVTRTNAHFDISADAFLSISTLLMEHKAATVAVLDASFERVFGLLNSLLATPNYATKRQALQLLAELLLDPVHFAVMQRYVASKRNLKLVMMLLREPSEALRMDAFNVFKIFVANPNKSAEVEAVLTRNHVKLLVFVSELGKGETSRGFCQEKQLVLFALKQLAEKDKMAQLKLKSGMGSPTSSSPTATLS